MSRKRLSLLFTIFALLLLTSCAEGTTTEPKNLHVEMNVTTEVTKDFKLIFKGTSNLPKEMPIMVSLKNVITGYSSQDKGTVLEDGSFQVGPFSDKNKGLATGQYSYTISTPTYDALPPSVQEIVGLNGENLSGTLIYNDEKYGKRVTKKDSIQVVNAAQQKKKEDLSKSKQDYINFLSIHHLEIMVFTVQYMDTIMASGGTLKFTKELEDISKKFQEKIDEGLAKTTDVEELSNIDFTYKKALEEYKLFTVKLITGLKQSDNKMVMEGVSHFDKAELYFESFTDKFELIRSN